MDGLMDGTGGQMKTFCKLTAQSPAASYVPLPRFLLQDEALWDISNDAKVLYALLQLFRRRLPAAGRRLSAARLPKPDLPVVSPRRAAPAAKAGTGHSQPEKTPPLRSLRHGHPRSLRQDKILSCLRQGHPPSAEGKIRPQTAVWCRQFRGEKPLNCKPPRTTKTARQYDFPRGREIEFYLST